MAYRIEFGLRPGAYFYAEFLILDRNTGAPMPLDGVGHQMVAYRDGFDDDVWGRYVPPYVPPMPDGPPSAIPPQPIDLPVAIASPACGRGWVLASDGTGEIKYPAPGVLAIALPAQRFWWAGQRRASLRFDLLAVPVADPSFTCLLAGGTISFGDRAMGSPRIVLEAYPLYPNAADAVQRITPSQWLRALSTVVLNGRAQLEAGISANPDDPNRIIFETSREVPANGAFESMAAVLLGLSVPVLTQIRAVALTIPA